MLALVATLSTPGQSFGRLHLLYSLAPLQRSEALTRSLFYGGVTLTFGLVLLLLNPLLSRIVLTPVRRVHDAMSRAATGDLQVRLPVHSRDEVGRMAESFNRMVGELEGSRREIEGYSRNLEEMVEARTLQLRESQASLLTLKNHLSTVIADAGTGVFSLDATGRVEAFSDRAERDPRSAPEGRPRAHPRGGARQVRESPVSPRWWPRCETDGLDVARPRSCASYPRGAAHCPSWPRPSSEKEAAPSGRWWCAKT